MKTILLLIFSPIFLLGLGGPKKTIGQTMVMGHITAEVIESISASSQALTSIVSESSTTNNLFTQGPSVSTLSAVKFGQTIISSGDMVTVNVVGNTLSFSYFRKADQLINSIPNDINLLSHPLIENTPNAPIPGATNLVDSLESGLNSGSYTVIFACN